MWLEKILFPVLLAIYNRWLPDDPCVFTKPQLQGHLPYSPSLALHQSMHLIFTTLLLFVSLIQMLWIHGTMSFQVWIPEASKILNILFRLTKHLWTDSVRVRWNTTVPLPLWPSSQKGPWYTVKVNTYLLTDRQK